MSKLHKCVKTVILLVLLIDFITSFFLKTPFESQCIVHRLYLHRPSMSCSRWQQGITLTSATMTWYRSKVRQDCAKTEMNEFVFLTSEAYKEICN